MTLALAAILTLASMPSHAYQIIFYDDFDTDGGTTLNWDGGANWTVENGSVDLVKNGDYGISCLGGEGHCVDLDGSTGGAGEILSIDLGPLDPAEYVFSYWLSGNQRDLGQDIASALSLGSTEVFTYEYHFIFGDEEWTQYKQRFTLDAVTSPVQLNFSHHGGDYVGIVLDDVQLKIASEPATIGLLGFALLAMGAMRRRIRR